MKPTFHAMQINSPFEDPCVFVRIERQRRALLFDIGNIEKLDFGNALKITDVFVTHTHMDHFIGFDTLLRTILKREAPLRIYGPKGIEDCVEGKLKGYEWNLIADYPVKIEVFGFDETRLNHCSFYAEDGFKRTDSGSIAFDGIVFDDSMLKAKGIILSHGIPSAAYCIEEDFHININKAALQERGLPVGPWLSDFKKAIRANDSACVFDISGRYYNMEELRDIAVITKGQKIAFVMDSAPTDDNIEKIISFVKGADTLFCEAYFLHKDIDRAIERNHLTALLTGRIAREAGVGSLQILHFSPKYMTCPEEIYKEAMDEFSP
jgi:ribonuclease Z